MPRATYDAAVVGAGPNGLAAAVALARAGRSVIVVEAADTVGGGTRTAELTLPGFRHDVCSAIHPLVLASPFLRELPLREHGLEPIQPPAPLAHPLDDGTAVMLERSLDRTADGLDGRDAEAWRRLFGPLVAAADALFGDILGPLRAPRHPLLAARFGFDALRSVTGLARARFEGERARSLFAGMAAHAIMPLDRRPSAAFGLVLGTLGHAVGWPVVRGGSQGIADALVSYLRSLGGEVVTGERVDSLDELPRCRSVLLDLTPREILRVAGDRLPPRYRKRLERYRYGPGAFKVDFALDGPIPWRAEECFRAGTVHLGGGLDEMEISQAGLLDGVHAERPFVLLAQQSLFDETRAPDGRHTVWTYCHVPNGSSEDMTERVEAQIERFAPGFRARVLARHVAGPLELERYNANFVGGDINGGIQDLRQLFTRPAPRFPPYATPAQRLFICSSSTPPGGGVHGMCGYFAARAALRAL